MTLHTPFLPTPDAGPAMRATSAAADKWAVLHEAMDVVAALAGVAAEPLRGDARDFPAVIHAAGGWRAALAREGIDDLAALIETGLAALLAVHEQGGDPAPAACALWHEFATARAGLLALTPPPPVPDLPRLT